LLNFAFHSHEIDQRGSAGRRERRHAGRQSAYLCNCATLVYGIIELATCLCLKYLRCMSVCVDLTHRWHRRVQQERCCCGTETSAKRTGRRVCTPPLRPTQVVDVRFRPGFDCVGACVCSSSRSLQGTAVHRRTCSDRRRWPRHGSSVAFCACVSLGFICATLNSTRRSGACTMGNN
jgi:hypothetical protein